MNPAGSATDIPSRGWRQIWIVRIGVLAVASLVTVFIYLLLGWPWQNPLSDIAWALEALIMIGGEMAMEAQSLSRVSLTNSGVGFHYPFATFEVPWNRLRVSSRAASNGLNVVAIEDVRPGRFGLARSHLVTHEQASAIRRFVQPA